MTHSTILPLRTERATLEDVGGKGANLARLACAGYPVPDGFLVTTHGYHAYVTANDLEARILHRVADIRPEDPDDLQVASEAIREWFSSGTIPPDLAGAIREAYAGIVRSLADESRSDSSKQRTQSVAVAVRSSATAEDLPEMSFAGQQDTFLNVVGEEALLQAVVRCWSSLWTARAIGYRARNGIPQDAVALAVVVQAMAPAEAAGVLFTANPLTGLRTETVIDATLGLGEALVAGRVEPDHYVVDTTENQIISKTLGAKALVVQGRDGGGVETFATEGAERQALPDPQILELAQLGQRVAAEYGFPQDVEWAWGNGQITLLQSRPITALFPLPEGIEPAGELKMLGSFGAVQGMLDPITPLGRDCLKAFLAGGGQIFGFHVTLETQRIIHMAGERLWADLTPVAQNAIGRRVISRALPFAEPTIVQALESVWGDPRLAANVGLPRLDTVRRMARFGLRLWPNVLQSWRDPDSWRARVQRRTDEWLADLQARGVAIGDAPDRLAQRAALVREFHHLLPYLVSDYLASIVAGMIPLVILFRIASHLAESGRAAEAGRSNLALEINRGLPHNVTTEMDLRLWETAQIIRSDPDSASRFRQAGASELAVEHVAGRLPDRAQAAIAGFMDRYGMRGVGEIDIGRPRWREEPTAIMQVLQSYLRIEDEALAPSAVFARGEQAALAASAQLEAAVRRTRGGRLKARVVRWAVSRFRALAGLRESPKFAIIRVMGIIRQGLLESGRELAEAGLLDRPDDLFFLHLGELEQIGGSPGQQLNEEAGVRWRGTIARRRDAYERERRRRQVPRLMLSDGRAFYEGLVAADQDGDVIVGGPVSPGVVEGLVRVVLDPVHAQLAPGEILVCPGTDPAWTPLFLAASGLVMEVGGMMTHGAIVAREYGLPAVVGVHQATTRLRTGQRIRVDGSTGRIVVLGSKSSQ